MTKVIAGVTVEASMLKRNGKRGQKAKERKERAREIIEKEMIPGVPNWATKQLERNARYGILEQHKSNIENRKLVSNAVPSNIERRRQFARSVTFSPKKRLRYFLRSELSDKPDNNGRYALMGGFVLDAPCSHFIGAYKSKPAAQTAQLLGYKEGTYRKLQICDRGPDFHYETVQYVKR